MKGRFSLVKKLCNELHHSGRIEWSDEERFQLRLELASLGTCYQALDELARHPASSEAMAKAQKALAGEL